MLKRYYNSIHLRLLKNQSIVMFEEVSSGVYHVVKDRNHKYANSNFVTSDIVANALSYNAKVSVNGNSGLFANFEVIQDN